MNQDHCQAPPIDSGTGAVPGRSAIRGRSEQRSGIGTAPSAWPHVSALELAPLPSAIPCARLHTVHVLREWGLQAQTDDFALIVSELVTNAVDASVVLSERPPVALRLLLTEGILRIEVWDQSPLNLEHHEADADDECGRGLMVIAALSDRWGSKRVSYLHKVVWAECDL